MQALAYRTYGTVQTRTVDENGIELALFKQITDQMESVDVDDPLAISTKADALYRNGQLWSLLSADLLHPENALNDETKRSLIAIAEFVRQTTPKGLSDSVVLKDLIELNHNIISALELMQRSQETRET